MLGLDEKKQGIWRKEGAKESALELRQKTLEQEILSNTITVEDDAGRNTSNLAAQLGRVLTFKELTDKLHLCNRTLIFERSIRNPEYSGIYIEKWRKQGTGRFQKEKVFLCGMESGPSPEFSVIHRTIKKVANPALLGSPEASDGKWLEVPTFLAETRGWRTVLIRLLKEGVITRASVQEHFGWTPSMESRHWSELT